MEVKHLGKLLKSIPSCALCFVVCVCVRVFVSVHVLCMCMCVCAGVHACMRACVMIQQLYSWVCTQQKCAYVYSKRYVLEC